jgi:hypothetical protein
MKIAMLVAPLLISGCAKTDSSDLLTTGIYAQISARATGDGDTDVLASLFVGNPINLNYVDLTGDDRLIASHGGQDKTMTELIVLNVVSHHASFPTDNAGDSFEVSFERSIDDGAPSSIATLPEQFTLGAVGASSSRAAPLTVTWSPVEPASTMRWQVEGDCIELEQQELGADAGTLTIEANRIRKRMGTTIADTCEMTLTVTRSRAGTLDPGFGKGGVIEGLQVREVMLTTTL